jgi:acyl-CoA reductase-like NAD-dependent aldehyde dehydrogenase
MTSTTDGGRSRQAGSPTIEFRRHYRQTINGELLDAPTSFAVRNPATKAIIARVPDATLDQLDAAVAAARSAFPGWSETSITERQRIVATIGDRIEEHAEEFMSLLTAEQGKPRTGAEFEIYGSMAWCREMAKMSLPEEILEESSELAKTIGRVDSTASA